MKKMIANLAAIVVCLGALAAAGQDASVEQALKNQYEQHVIVLRTAFQADEQEFDSTGKPLKDPRTDEWKIFGPILVHKFSVDAKGIQLEGPRVVLKPDDRDKQKAPTAMPLGKPIKIRIHLDHLLESTDEARVILDRVFFPDAQTSDYPQPAFWRPDQTPDSPRPAHGYSRNKCGWPMPLYQPMADYSEPAREQHIQGNVLLHVVIDTAGTVSRIAITRPLGWGLDEKAVEKVKTWRFKLLICDGQPISFETSVELSFSLF